MNNLPYLRGALLMSLADRKALTTKDLAKPWSLLPLGTNPAEIAVPSEVDCATGQAGLVPSIAHSAMTTLLLDDSPHKARLQPNNHVCIPEYTSSLREKDLQQIWREKVTRTPKSRKRKWNINESVPDQTESAEILSPSSDSDPTIISSTSDHVEHSSIPIPLAERTHISSRSSAEPYDPTILAVIGVLDELKRQSSVAGWIHGGGLWDIAPIPEVEKEFIGTTPASDASIVEDMPPLTGFLEAPLPTKKEDPAAQEHVEQVVSSSAQLVTADMAMIQTGNGSITADVSVEDAAPSAGVESVGMWFNDEPTLSYWVWRGRRALDSLGIEADHGVTG